MSNPKLESLCDDLNATFDNVSPMYGDGELVVYLPLDAHSRPDPADIDTQVMDFLSSRGYTPRVDLDGQAVVATY